MTQINSCTVSVAIALALLGGSFATMTVPRSQHAEIQQTFSPELADRYAKIVAERRNHYLQGLVLGSVLAFGVTYAFGGSHRVATFVAITMLTGVVYYRLMPKSDYMLNHLQTEAQNKAWLKIYKSYQSRYMYGMILGGLASVFVAQAVC